MIKIVLDTNIIISAALSPQGNPAKIMGFVTNNYDATLYYNAAILAEYKKVLAYERLKIPADRQKAYLEAIQETGQVISPNKSDIAMPDESDRIFYDTAKAGNAYLVTGNMKHYPTEPFIVTPAQFIDLLEI